jgi:demethylmenaquinone methyltransferase/2-methoxy-6-polyprenyl-1,4-benzoquinol methylase
MIHRRGQFNQQAPKGMSTYRTVAWIYDMLAAVYSGGSIERCKQAQIAALIPETRVLFVGAGSGADAVTAAARSVSVTAVECSPHMLARLRSRPELRRQPVASHLEIIEGDVMAHSRYGYYDAVMANFFLNTFSQARMPGSIAHLMQLLKPEGQLIIGDFSPLRGGHVGRLLQTLHHHLPMLTFSLLTGSDWHRIHDYRSRLALLGVTLHSSCAFGAFGIGPRWYESIVARKLPCR